MGDQFGRKRVFLFGVIFFTLASILCGIATSPGTLIIGRALQGIGAAFLVPGSLAIISATFESERTRTGDRHLVGIQRDHDGDRAGQRRLADRTRQLARGVLSERAARCRSCSCCRCGS